MVKILLEYPGLDVNEPDETDNTPLHRAASKGHLDVVNILLKHLQTDVNVYTYSTAWHEAARKGFVNVINAFLDHPLFDVNLPASSDATLLHVAVCEGLGDGTDPAEPTRNSCR